MEKNHSCPLCNIQGREVKTNTVRNLVIDELADQIKKDTYFICMNEECKVVYFGLEGLKSYSKDQIKVPVWFKTDANPKYICYCNQVKEQQILDAVINEGAENMKDIIRITGAMKNARCEEKNPLGKCCSPIIQENIKKALEIKG